MIFKSKPNNFKEDIQVVGCYLQYGDEFVLLHRHNHKTEGGKLGLPAGKVDPGETIHQAMRRELFEETGIVFDEKELQYFNFLYVRNKEYDIIFHMFFVSLSEKPTIELASAEHQGYLWTRPEKALNMNLVHDLDECIRLFYGDNV